MKKYLLMFLCAGYILQSFQAQTSTLVTVGSDGKLIYTPDAVGSVIPDFSGVGYKNSEVSIPEVAVVKTVTAVSGDNYSHVQAAIDEVAAMPLQSNGFRGAILFAAGLYEISAQLSISTSGIVLRGEGTTTEFRATGTTQYDLIRINGGAVTENTSTLKKITDAFVPVGAKTITVERGHSFVAGDWVYLRREPNAAWIAMLGMDQLATPLLPDVVNWTAAEYKINYERRILSVNGNQLTLDAPVVDIIDAQYADGYVTKISSTRINNIGIENLKLTSTYTTSWASSVSGVAHDEQHGWNAVRIVAARDCWVKNVTAYYFGYSCVNIGPSASFITVDNCAMYDPISLIDGGRRYSFIVDGQRNLVQNCFTRNGRHDYVTGAKAAGPNVFYNSTSTLQRNDMGTHHRWATGILFDNITGNGELNVQDRQTSGKGHGWAGSQIMFWNCNANKIITQSPPSHHTNWAIGCTAPTVTNVGYWATRTSGVVQSRNNPIAAIPGLFTAQLNERLENLVSIPEISYSANNSAANGNFETWTNTTAMPNSWSIGAGAWGTQYYYQTDDVQGKVLRLTDPTSSSVSARRFNTTANINIPTQGVYRVSLKVKGNVGLRGVILVKGTAAPSTLTQSATNHFTLISDYPSGTIVNDWTTLSYTITVPSTATFGTDYRLHISWSSSLSSKPTCDFLIDDISLLCVLANYTGNVSASDISYGQDCDVYLETGSHMTINQSTTVKSLTVQRGAKLTINTTLSTSNALVLESDADGTGTIIDNYTSPTINARVKQYLTAGRNWYMSTPLQAADASALNRGTSVQYYNETNGQWLEATGTLARGKGYIQVANSTQGTTGNVEFSGTTNSGDVPVTLTNSPAGGKGFNLVGNPYPSYVSWSAVVADNAAANMPTGTMWYRTINYNGKSAWSPNTVYSADDILYNGTRFYKATTGGTSAASGGPTGTGTAISDGSVVWTYEGSVYIFATVNAAGIASPSTVSNLIPPMQAFWVKSNGGTLTFKNNMRMHETESNRLKARASGDAIPFVRLNVSNGASADEVVIYASELASNAFDLYDAPKYFNTGGSNQAQIFTTSENEKLAINALNRIEAGAALSLGFVTETANRFEIKATEFNNNGLALILRDNRSLAEFDLTYGESYTFSSDAVNDASRFTLLFRSEDATTSVEPAHNPQVLVFANASGQIEIHAPAGSSYSVCNAVGQKINSGKTVSQSEIIANNLSAGIYVIKVNNSTRKVILSNTPG
ncbi:MAG: T9SS type A sorting domain-containing protein [Paludibacter sp.]|jgi:hypothetical protein|nr:T9SS type A sorting domain-containing protein [Paludibacter sp.]